MTCLISGYVTYSKHHQMPKRARGDPIEYVRNVRLRAVRQFWDWFRQLLRPRRLHLSADGRGPYIGHRSMWAWDHIRGLEYWRVGLSEFRMQNL